MGMSSPAPVPGCRALPHIAVAAIGAPAPDGRFVSSAPVVALCHVARRMVPRWFFPLKGMVRMTACPAIRPLLCPVSASLYKEH